MGKRGPCYLFIPITSDQYPQKARRPSFSVLANYHLRLLGMDDLRSWQEALKDYMIMGSALHAKRGDELCLSRKKE